MTIKAINQFYKTLKEAKVGDEVGLELNNADYDLLKRHNGDVIVFY